MSRTSSISNLLAASSIAAMGALLSTTASATPVLHVGDIFNTSGNGVAFSSIHTSTNGAGGGSGRGGISGGVQYSWDTSASAGGVFGEDTTLTFDQGSTTVFNNGTFKLDLWTSSSVLTVGAAQPSGPNNHGSINVPGGVGSVAVTHDIGGSINFTIEQLTGPNDGAILSDTFNFSETMRMGPINGIGEKDGTFFTFLWGDTGSGDPLCLGQISCSAIEDHFYAANGLGIDIAFSGTPVPEPASLALAALGLVGVGFARRRRKTA